MSHPKIFTFNAKEALRLDSLVCDYLSSDSHLELSRSQIKKLVNEGGVKVDNQVCVKPGVVVKEGALVEILIPSTEVPNYRASQHKLAILYEDELLMVIDKPQGISMHPGAGSSQDTLLDAVSEHLTIKPEKWPSGMRPGIVHRLDKDTTGVVVVAKTPLAHEKLSSQFERRTVKRSYIALALSTPRGRRVVRVEDSGVIDSNFGRDQKDRKKMSVLADKDRGRRAVTNWQVVERMSYAVLLKLRLETGRTHQIRVHLTHIGSPIIGDRTYGDFSLLPKVLSNAATSFGRQALHAAQLGFVHPATGISLEFESALPQDFEGLIGEFRKI